MTTIQNMTNFTQLSLYDTWQSTKENNCRNILLIKTIIIKEDKGGNNMDTNLYISFFFFNNID